MTHVLAIRRSRGPSDHYRDEENDHEENEFGECRKALACLFQSELCACPTHMQKIGISSSRDRWFMKSNVAVVRFLDADTSPESAADSVTAKV
jgi:hypothetical protein